MCGSVRALPNGSTIGDPPRETQSLLSAIIFIAAQDYFMAILVDNRLSSPVPRGIVDDRAIPFPDTHTPYMGRMLKCLLQDDAMTGLFELKEMRASILQRRLGSRRLVTKKGSLLPGSVYGVSLLASQSMHLASNAGI